MTRGRARHDLALPRGVDASELTRDLVAEHDLFVSAGIVGPSMRSMVVDSWRRSLAQGLDPEQSTAPIRLDRAALTEARATHPLTQVMPVVRRVLVDGAADAGLLVAVSDAAGHLLYVEGASRLRSRAEHIHFVEGADWSEASAGTNAPGTALTLGRPVQLLGPEHLARQVTPWSCTAAPIHDPDTGHLLGVLDVTGGPDVAAPAALSLVLATVAAVESELRVARLEGRSPHHVSTSGAELAVLGRATGVLHRGPSTTHLTLRGSELVLILATAPHGLSTAEVAVGLSEDDQAPVTVRVEMSRIRRALVPLRLDSRPYRLAQPLTTDIDHVRAALRAGRLVQALASYPGPVLPRSTAPAIRTLREDLHLDLRSAVLASQDPEALVALAESPSGHDDYEVWWQIRAVSPVGSPRRLRAEAQLDRLDRALR